MIRISIDAMGGDFGPSVVLPALRGWPNGAGCDVPHLRPRGSDPPRAGQAAVPGGQGNGDALRRLGADGRQAEPGAAPRPLEVVDVEGDRGGEERRGRCLRFRRQYRRADGHVEILPAHHGGDRPPGDRGDLADGARRERGLDVGATIGADAHQLIDFAILGTAMARALFGKARPTVGLLNVGVEEIKGQEDVREAGQLLRDADLKSMDYHGFVEGDDIGKGTVDVVVTEGFSGNIALKSAEGTAKQIGEYLRAAMSRTLMARIGYLFAKSAFAALREKMDVRKINGGVFLGLNGIVVKSHGGADEEGIAAAVELGYDMAKNGLIDRIRGDLDQFHASRVTIRESARTEGEQDI